MSDPADYVVEEFHSIARDHVRPPLRSRRLASWMFSVQGLAIAVVAALVAYSAYVLRSGATRQAPASAQTETTGISLSELPLLGIPEMPLAERSVLGIDSSLSTEPLRLFLLGTMPGDTPYTGIAYLGTDPRNPQTMGVGSLLPNGTRIAQIHADHVVLERDGRRVVLKLDQQVDIAIDGPQALGGAPLMASRDEALRRQLASVSAPAAERVARPQPVGALRDINEVVRAQPVFRESLAIGFSVLAGAQAGRFRQLGLEPGDVVTAIDGRVVTEAVQWSDVSAPLLAGQSVVVSVERQGQTLALVLDGSALLSAEAPTLPGNPGIAAHTLTTHEVVGHGSNKTEQLQASRP